MELVRVDTQYAYKQIREKITKLVLKPGASIDEGALAKELDIGLIPVREALKLLIHEHLIDAPPRGLFVSEVNISDLEQISEIRTLLEPYCAKKAAERARPDHILVLESLSAEQTQINADQSEELFDLDHKFHQAIAKAADNKYLAQILEDFYGFSQRIWYLALPSIEFLPASVSIHLELVEAIKNHNSQRAEAIMAEHIQDFYQKVFKILEEKKGNNK
jgi:DNA-binding GntR family transcriptional regulator